MTMIVERPVILPKPVKFRKVRRLPACQVWDLGLTRTQAIGVALSVPMSKTPMHECQALAPSVLRHLRALGWKLVRA